MTKDDLQVKEERRLSLTVTTIVKKRKLKKMRKKICNLSASHSNQYRNNPRQCLKCLHNNRRVNLQEDLLRESREAMLRDRRLITSLLT